MMQEDLRNVQKETIVQVTIDLMIEEVKKEGKVTIENGGVGDLKTMEEQIEKATKWKKKKALQMR